MLVVYFSKIGVHKKVLMYRQTKLELFLTQKRDVSPNIYVNIINKDPAEWSSHNFYK